MAHPAPALTIGDADRQVLTRIAKSSTAAHREVVRAQVLLAAGDGVANSEIARRFPVSTVTVRAWRAAFVRDGLTGWGVVAPGRGRKPSIPDETIAEIVRVTTTETPAGGGTHWSTRSLAKRMGISHTTVHRVWQSLGLKPHLVDSFKVSNDPEFAEKVVDVVGLYLDPPEKAIVLCMDEKSQIQALDRTQATLPLRPGRAQTMTHDYKRNGTTTLFAALDVLTGTVIGECMARHRHTEFLAFLKTIDAQVPKHLQIHLILDNYSTHKHETVKHWLSNHRRFHLHFTPTSSSWLNQVERWFRDLTEKNLRRGIFRSVPDLIANIETYIEHNNQHPAPFTWTAKAETILAKVSRARTALTQRAS